MTTLKVGIASYQEMKARTMAVARGTRRIAADEPMVWFTSTESFAKVLSASNRKLLEVIAQQAPSSLDELARITGRAKSSLSRTLKTMEGCGLVRLERGDRGRIAPKLTHDRIELDLLLIDPRIRPSPESRLTERPLARVASRVATPEPRKPDHRTIKDL
jgi:predicted transcriptional regulator